METFSVVQLEPLTPTTLVLTLQTAYGNDFEFAAGQYGAFHLKPQGRPTPARCFSLIKVPGRSDQLQIAFRVQGSFTSALARLQEDDTVYMQGPFGDFTYDLQAGGTVMLAGGIGITPFVSMLRATSVMGPPHKTLLLYAARNNYDIPFGQEIETIARRQSNLEVAFFSSQPATNPILKRLRHGRIDEPILKNIIRKSPATTKFMVCGPNNFRDQMVSQLRALGVPEDEIVVESFGPQSGGARQKAGLLSRRIYGWTAAAIVLSFGAIASWNTIETAEAAATAGATKNSNSATAGNVNSTSQGTSTSSDTSSSSAQPSTTPTYTNYYQQPVSTVS